MSQINAYTMLKFICNGQMDIGREASEDLESTYRKICNAAQLFYDKDNWQGLTTDERIVFDKLKISYKILTGKDIELTYNCPA